MDHEKQGKKKKKVVAYCRVSTLEQKRKGYGIDIQIRDATLFAERRGLFIDKFYRDEGESGIKEERKALKTLLRDCRSGRIGKVILPTLDRLSREVRIAENLFYEFKNLKIKVLIADMPNYSGERKDILFRQLHEIIAEDNRREIIERLWKGRRERVRRGLFPGGNLPYGYERKDRSVVICLKEARIVTYIYELARSGVSGQKIASILNKENNVRRNGKPWTQRQVCRIIRNEKTYLGMLHYGTVISKNNLMAILSSAS